MDAGARKEFLAFLATVDRERPRNGDFLARVQQVFAEAEVCVACGAVQSDMRSCIVCPGDVTS